MINIIPAQIEDLPLLVNLENKYGFSAWSEKQLERSLSCNDVYIVKHHQDMAGFLILHCVADELELLNVVIDSPYRKKGYARKALIYVLEKYARSDINYCFLEVAVTNHDAIALYSHVGFVESGIRKGYYKKNKQSIDALLMCCDISHFSLENESLA